MTNSLSNLVDDLVERINTNKCKYRRNDKNMKRVELNIRSVSIVLKT